MNEQIPDMAYITRMNYERTAKCWWVRFVVTTNGVQKLIAQKSFRDSNYIDGKDEALFFAQGWRDDIYSTLVKEGIIAGYQGRGNSSVPPAYIIPKPNNSSGFVGVEKNDFYYQKNVGGVLYNVHCYHWKATWVEYDIYKGIYRRRARATSFSIRRWGEEVAFEKALLLRLQKVEYILSPNHLKIREAYIKRKGELQNG